MANFENQCCPVCAKPFEADDDIVVCPVCGTPCHRACYKEKGQCPNAALHGTGFIYGESSPHFEEDETEVKVGSEDLKPEAEPNITDDGYITCEKCGAKLRRGTMFCTQCGARQNSSVNGNTPPDPRLIVPSPDVKYEKSTAMIDDITAEDAAAVVGRRCEKFIPKFLRNKKVNWNWSAFIFGGYYFFYRKMNIEGILTLVLDLIVELLSMVLFAGNLEALNTLMQGISSEATSEEIMALYQSSEFLEAAEEAMPLYIAMFAGLLVIHILCGMFADSLYRRSVVNKVKKVDSRLETDESVMEVEAQRVSTGDLRRMYLARRGGTNIFAPILAYLILEIVLSFLGI